MEKCVHADFPLTQHRRALGGLAVRRRRLSRVPGNVSYEVFQLLQSAGKNLTDERPFQVVTNRVLANGETPSQDVDSVRGQDSTRVHVGATVAAVCVDDAPVPGDDLSTYHVGQDLQLRLRVTGAAEEAAHDPNGTLVSRQNSVHGARQLRPSTLSAHVQQARRRADVYRPEKPGCQADAGSLGVVAAAVRPGLRRRGAGPGRGWANVVPGQVGDEVC